MVLCRAALFGIADACSNLELSSPPRGSQVQAGCLGTMLGVDDHIFGSPYNTHSAELGWSYISPEKDSCHF